MKSVKLIRSFEPPFSIAKDSYIVKALKPLIKTVKYIPHIPPGKSHLPTYFPYITRYNVYSEPKDLYPGKTLRKFHKIQRLHVALEVLMSSRLLVSKDIIERTIMLDKLITRFIRVITTLKLLKHLSISFINLNLFLILFDQYHPLHDKLI